MLGQILAELPEIGLFEVGWLLICLGLLFFAMGFFFYLRRRSARQQTLRRVNQQFNGVSVKALAPDAYFCGMQRHWDSQWQGNGVLMLTKERLYFRLWGKNLDLSIPLKRVEEAEIVYERGPFFFPRKHIKVVYRGMDDHPRTAVWHTEKPQDWVRMIHDSLKENNLDEKGAPPEHIS